MRSEERQAAKNRADEACDFFDRCLARGRSRKEATDLTVAYLLGRVAEPEESETDKPLWA